MTSVKLKRADGFFLSRPEIKSFASLLTCTVYVHSNELLARRLLPRLEGWTKTIGARHAQESLIPSHTHERGEKSVHGKHRQTRTHLGILWPVEIDPPDPVIRGGMVTSFEWNGSK
jgi:hypothetical protein